ncbi:hypothetical protein AQUCO_02700167v1 [Aquilegia coerulea]|uniref:Uncharacterized protein n=1 Tax=Aquilegia coerulea TaxID=218851 RepID=A0A2G5D5J2_AQUCA|nr:hypothetical protein AQUCO_02700167v1 [Aquilegia coerulea]
MKTVSGSVISSNPISLSKAASFLSEFVSVKENGASQAASAFLRRTSTAFNELIQFHEQLEIEISTKKEKRRFFEELENGKVMGIDENVRKGVKTVDEKSSRGNNVARFKEKEENVVYSKSSRDLGNAESVNFIENGGSGKKKKKKKKEMSELKVEVEEKKVREAGERSSELEVGNGKKKKKHGEMSEVREEMREREEVGKEKNKERKKRKKVEDESTISLDNSEERHSRKKKKRRHDD